MSDMIHLGVSPKEKYGDGPVAVGMPEGEGREIFPEFCYSGPKELDLPDEGTMKICFTKRRESSSKRSDGSHWYECSIEVKCICEVDDEEPDEPTHRDRSAEEALDAIAEALESAKGE